MQTIQTGNEYIKNILLYSISILISVILIGYAVNVFPLAGGDSIVFIAPALFYSKGFGLINPLYFVADLTDLTHHSLFNYYVPLFPLLLGYISKIHPGIKTIFLACSLFGITSIWLYTRELFYLWKKETNVLTKALLLFSIPYLATYFMPAFGRPEILSSLLIFLIYLICLNRNAIGKIVFNILIVILFSLLISTQLLGFYFCFLLFLTYEFNNSTNFYRSLLVNLGRGIIILLLFLFVIWLSPVGIINTISGIRLHIAYILQRNDRGDFLYFFYWFLSSMNFGFFIIFCIGAFFYLRAILDKTRQLDSVKIVIISFLQLLLLFGLVRFILYTPPTIYNATQFILPLLVFVVTKIINLKKRNIHFCLLLFVFIAGTIIFIRVFTLFTDYVKDGRDFDHASITFNNAISNYKDASISPGLWVLSNKPEKLKILHGDNYKNGDIVIVQNSFEELPGSIAKNWDKLYDCRVPAAHKVLGMPLRHPQGYTFVVYRVK